jgi:subtilisin family serine protease
MAKKVSKASFRYGGVVVDFTKSTTQAAVQYNPGLKPAKKAKRGATTSERGSRSAAPPPMQGFEIVNGRGIDRKLDKLRSSESVAIGTHVWNVGGDEDTPFIPTGKVYVEFAPEGNVLEERALLEGLGLSIKELVGENGYWVQVTAASPNPIKCVIQLQKNKKIRVAEPEFMTLPAERAFSQPSGQFVGTQWHHKNTGQPIPIIDIPNAVFGSHHFKPGADAKVQDAWAFLETLGNKSIKIAVIDTGFAINHPQLRGDGTKVIFPFNAAERTSDVSPLVQYSDGSMGVYNHGTSCAAVAAGYWDNKGVLGSCPNARIIPIKLDILSDEAIKNAFEHALLNGADVISCSLGFPKPVPLSTFITNYITTVVRQGRGGRGLPMFFAAGNANPASNNQPRQASDFAAHPEVFCVTASNSFDVRSSYSFFSPNAFLCAPTNGDNGVGITTATCDIGNDGRSVTLDYTSGFGGTSSATPLAAGICALMLTANPDLNINQIRTILRQTCDKIGPAGTYDANGRSPFYGFGRINALRAVQMAKGGGTPAPQPNPQPQSNPQPQPAPTTGTGLRGRVVSKFLNVRSSPSTSAPKVAELANGAVVNLLEKVGTWWRIGNSQFVTGDFIQVLPSNRQGKVISATLNVRSGPSVTAAKVAELASGAVVNILETTTDGWMRIGDGRWVTARFVQTI